MKQLSVVKNPVLFQGEKYLNKNKSYFEGWYFKNISPTKAISFIPGIHIEGKNKKAFIQVITKDESYYLNYNINDFKFNKSFFEIQIGKNTFSQNGIHLEIEDKKQNLTLYGDIQYINHKTIKRNFLNPNIMGPFSYIPFMECNHAIISMKNSTQGSININGKEINFDHMIGYIEKDWGCSFPKSYVWCQGNNFGKTNTSFMLSIAHIPFKFMNFRGLICDLIIEEKEYKFATYNGAKIIKYETSHDFLEAELKKGPYLLKMKATCEKGNKLAAPVKGRMEKDIFESINAVVTITLEEKNRVIFHDTSTNGGLEIVE